MRWLAACFLCVLLPGCKDTGIRTGLIGGQQGLHDAAASYTPADMRAIVSRQRFDGRRIICTEPLPDVATAFAQSAQATISGGNGVANGSLGGGYASAQAAMELAGRSTALLGLRDGLYRACEAYANGIIGDDTYALVLSRYGQLMVTLFLGQDLATADARTVWTTLPPSLDPLKTQPAPKQGGVADIMPEGVREPRLVKAAWTPVAEASHRSGPSRAAGGSTDPASAPDTTASAIAAMQARYLDLDQGFHETLFVACLADNDPTREGQQPNRFLVPICEALERSYGRRLAVEAGKQRAR